MQTYIDMQKLMYILYINTSIRTYTDTYAYITGYTGYIIETYTHSYKYTQPDFDSLISLAL